MKAHAHLPHRIGLLFCLLPLLLGARALPAAGSDAAADVATDVTTDPAASAAAGTAPADTTGDTSETDAPDEGPAGVEPAHPADDANPAVVGHLLLADAAMQQQDLPGAAREFTLAAETSDDVTIAERATQFNFGAGFDAYAVRSARRWAELAPDNPVAREVLGRVLLRRHDVERAAVELGRAMGATEPRRDEVYLALAADLATEDDARLVTRTLARLAARDPLSPGLQLALGTAALRSGDHDLAVAAAEAAGQDDPEWLEPQLLGARALAASGQGDAALARLDALATVKPDPAVELDTARLLADLGRSGEARERLARLEANHPGNPDVRRTAAFLDLAEGDLDAAGREFEALAAGGAQERFESFYYLGQIEARRGNPGEARRLYGRISAGPYLVPAQLAIAETFWREHRPDQGVETLVTFGRDYPAQAYGVLAFRAQLLQSMSRPADALAVYTEALAFKPDAVSMLLDRGALLEQQGRVDEALADLEQAVRIAPDDAAALNAYGYTLANRTRRTGAAYRLVRRALEIEPDSAAIQDSMGWVLQRRGRGAEARSYLEAAFDHLADPEIASHLAEVWWGLGERERAGDLLLATLVAYPENKTAAAAARKLLK